MKKVENYFSQFPRLKKVAIAFINWSSGNFFFKFLGKIRTYIVLALNSKKPHRQLEIGPGFYRIPGFETLDILPGINVDYTLDATQPLPFADNSFDLIYTSHILEHVPWYLVGSVLQEWVRILKPGGKLEVWVPNGLKICRAFVEAEINGSKEFLDDKWLRFNPEKDPCKWASGRIFTYGDGTGKTNHPNWHRALFSPRYLKKLFTQAGLKKVRELDRKLVRGHDHGWINLGVTGDK